ncbi:hypothetical protein HN51_006216 [Arachis hypogaea]|uniref:Uncharacterized protein n=1 Tax=Arachis hypogaea TaxID=3818 RepID=A0A445DBN6_ARAHY|nr:uncharacterized protein DS421_14g488620 [Arachis hypogaea]RYR60581.1 hypothetical protein Ahy_A04g017632 [Arachis hypogaea]
MDSDNQLQPDLESGSNSPTSKPSDPEPTSKPQENNNNSPKKPIANGNSNPNNPTSNPNNPNSNGDDEDPTLEDTNDTTLGKGIQTTFKTASNLGNFLPTGTNLVFGALIPTIYKSGQCSSLSVTMMIFALVFCSFFCFFSCFTDSVEQPAKDSKGNNKTKVYYGFVTTKGLWVQNHRGYIGGRRYKLGFADVLHAVLSMVVFLAMAFSDQRVIDCLFPKHVDDMEQVMRTLVLVVGFLCSSLFLLFPVHRRGFLPSLPKNANATSTVTTTATAAANTNTNTTATAEKNV